MALNLFYQGDIYEKNADIPDYTGNTAFGSCHDVLFSEPDELFSNYKNLSEQYDSHRKTAGGWLKMEVVIAGLGAGGLFAGLTIKKNNRDINVTFIDRKDFELLHPCGIPYAIERRIKSFESIKHSLPDMGFSKYLKHEIRCVNPAEKTVEATSLEDGNSISIKYDKLIIATGASALLPPVPGVNELLNKGVFTLDSYQDGIALSGYLKEGMSAAVVGAGAIGLETAAALKKRGLDVTLVEMLPYALAKAVDQDISEVLQSGLADSGIKLMFNSKLEKINGSEKLESIIVDGNELKIDILVLAAGVKANIGFLDNSGIEVGKWGVKVNDKMQTNIQDIYAIGDCVQLKSLIDKRDWMMQLAVAAYKQGIVAGMNIAGKERAYKGALTTFVSKIGDIEIAATGFNSHFAGENIIIGKARGPTKPEWCSGGSEITVKLIIDKSTGRILGGQAVGHEGTAERINVISTAIQAGFTVHDLSDTELAYCPAVSQTYDVLMQAADNAMRKMGG